MPPSQRPSLTTTRQRRQRRPPLHHCCVVLISVALLINTVVVFVTIHRRHPNENNANEHGVGFLRGGGGRDARDLFFSQLQLSLSLISTTPSITITEAEYWRHIIMLDSNKNNDCAVITTNITTFQDTLQRYWTLHPELANGPSFCSLPPSAEPQCNETHYSVILYYNNYFYNNNATDHESSTSSTTAIANANAAGAEDDHRYRRLPPLRSMVTQIMALFSYPTVQEIHLVLPVQQEPMSALWSSLSSRYGRLMEQWIKRGIIHVHTTSNGINTTTTTTSTQEEWISQVSTQAVLLLDVQQQKDWNGTFLKRQFHSWRQHPNTLVAQRQWQWPLNRQHPTTATTTTTTTAGSTKSSSLSSSLSSCSIPSLHGMMMHRNHLCLLNHPMVRTMALARPNQYPLPQSQQQSQQKRQQLIDNETAAILWMLFHRVSPGYAVVLPTTSSNETTTATATAGAVFTSPLHRSSLSSSSSSKHHFRGGGFNGECPCQININDHDSNDVPLQDLCQDQSSVVTTATTTTTTG